MRKIKPMLWVLMAVIAVMITGFLIYASDIYPADAVARALIPIEQKDDAVFVLEGNDTGIIFYPGAKVEYTAYLPLLKQIQQRTGATVFLQRMPLSMAIFSVNAAESIMENHPEIDRWIMAGHSMGGAMSSAFAADHASETQGLLLFGAYNYGGYDQDKTLTVYGSLNTSVAEQVNTSTNVVVIDGGNHANFGNYGDQKGDAKATITHEEQQQQAVDAVVHFLEYQIVK